MACVLMSLDITIRLAQRAKVVVTKRLEPGCHFPLAAHELFEYDVLILLLSVWCGMIIKELFNRPLFLYK